MPWPIAHRGFTASSLAGSSSGLFRYIALRLYSRPNLVFVDYMTDFRVNPQAMVRNGCRWLALAFKHPALLSGVLATGLVLGVRQTGGLQSLELLAFDQMVRLRPDAGADPRLLVVAITEDDIRSQNRWPISDQVVAQLLAKLNQYKPKVIGLDIYRDVPQSPGHEGSPQAVAN